MPPKKSNITSRQKFLDYLFNVFSRLDLFLHQMLKEMEALMTADGREWSEELWDTKPKKALKKKTKKTVLASPNGYRDREDLRAVKQDLRAEW